MIEGNSKHINQNTTEIVADFSTGIAKAFTKELLLNQLQRKIKNINSYPHAEVLQFKNAVAKYHKINPDNVVVCNGSSDAFYLIAHCFRGSKTYIRVPSIHVYENACVLFEHEISFGSELAFSKQYNMVWLCNPNNPDATLLKRAEIEALCAENPNITFVIDESSGDLCTGFQTSIPVINKCKNLIVARSLSNAFVIPGLRLAYAITNAQTAQEICKLQVPRNLNSFAIEAGIYIMNNYDFLRVDEKELSLTSKKLQKELAKLEGLKVYPSNCNFFLVELVNGSAPDLKKYLTEKHGLLIKDVSEMNGLGPGFFRLTARGNQHNTLLVDAIIEWLSINKHLTNK